MRRKQIPVEFGIAFAAEKTPLDCHRGAEMMILWPFDGINGLMGRRLCSLTAAVPIS